MTVHGGIHVFVARCCVYHRATGKSIEHVEENEASEGHGGISGSDHLVLHLRDVTTNPYTHAGSSNTTVLALLLL